MVGPLDKAKLAAHKSLSEELAGFQANIVPTFEALGIHAALPAADSIETLLNSAAPDFDRLLGALRTVMGRLWTLHNLESAASAFAERWEWIVLGYRAALVTTFARNLRSEAAQPGSFTRLASLIPAWVLRSSDGALPWWGSDELAGTDWVREYLPNPVRRSPQGRGRFNTLLSNIPFSCEVLGAAYTRRTLQRSLQEGQPQPDGPVRDLVHDVLQMDDEDESDQTLEFWDGALTQLLWLAAVSGGWLSE